MNDSHLNLSPRIISIIRGVSLH